VKLADFVEMVALIAVTVSAIIIGSMFSNIVIGTVFAGVYAFFGSFAVAALAARRKNGSYAEK
jgi:hypothetical protein